MPNAGKYHVSVTDKKTGTPIGDYAVISDGSARPERIALESTVFDGRFKTLADARSRAHCVVISRPEQ